MLELTEYLNLIKSNLVIVKFTAKWCHPCKQIAPLFEQLGQKYESIIKFIEIDIDNREITDYEDIKALPTFLFYGEGEKIIELNFTGANEELLKTNVNKFLELNFPISLNY